MSKAASEPLFYLDQEFDLTQTWEPGPGVKALMEARWVGQIVWATLPGSQVTPTQMGGYSRVVVGRVATHYSGGWCVQSQYGKCYPIVPGMALKPLPGKLSDYSW